MEVYIIRFLMILLTLYLSSQKKSLIYILLGLQLRLWQLRPSWQKMFLNKLAESYQVRGCTHSRISYCSSS